MFEFKDVLSNRDQHLTDAQMAELKEYYESIKLLSEGDLNLEFNNKDQYHAGMVLATLYYKSNNSIKIFTGSFSGEVSSPDFYRNALKNAAERGVDIEVVFEKSPEEASPCFRDLKGLQSKDGFREKIKMFVLKSDITKTVNSKGLQHFAIGDDKMFRYETDKTYFKAFCNFDDKSTVQKLNSNFQVLKLNANPL